MAAKPIKPTKAQLAEAKVRAAASGISMNQSAKGLRNASKAIVAGASMLPAGRAVKAAATIAKSTAKSTVKKTLAEPSKASVKVKPAAKQKPNPPDMAKIADKYESRAQRTLDYPGLTRKELIQTRQLAMGERPATRPKGFGSGASRVKINSNPVRANRTRSGKKTN